MKRRRTLHQSLPGLRHIFLYFWPYLRKQHGLIAGSVLALLAEVGLRTLEPWPLKFIFDHVLGTKRRGGSPALPSVVALDPATIITLSALAIVIISGLRTLADY